jgi:hypothetical protein
MLAEVPPWIYQVTRSKSEALKKGAKRKISKNDQRKAPEPPGLAGDNSWVMQWIVLCGIPYRDSGATASPDPANQLHYFSFPLPSNGAGHMATGRLYCSSLTFQE